MMSTFHGPESSGLTYVSKIGAVTRISVRFVVAAGRLASLADRC